MGNRKKRGLSVDSCYCIGRSERLNGKGEILPEVLTDDEHLRDIIRTHPGLLWKCAERAAQGNGDEHYRSDRDLV